MFNGPLSLRFQPLPWGAITALELSAGVLLDRLPNSLASMRLDIQSDAAAQPMLTLQQHSTVAMSNLQHAVSLLLVPANLQSLTLADPFAQ